MTFVDRLRAAWRILRGKTGPVRGGSTHFVIRGMDDVALKAIEEWAADVYRKRGDR